MNWQKADACKPETYQHLLGDKTAVVHTLGTLLEDARYKAALAKGDLPALMKVAAEKFTRSGNPLEEPSKKGGYDELNRDAGELISIHDASSCSLFRCAILSSSCMRDVRVHRARRPIGQPARIRVRICGGHLPPLHFRSIHRIEARGRAGH